MGRYGDDLEKFHMGAIAAKCSGNIQTEVVIVVA